MSETIKWEVSSFDGLDTDSLYAILRLRAEVFVVEQSIVYLDTDNKDQSAIHLQGYIGDDLVAYCRLFKKGDYFDEAAIGRVVVSPKYRNIGYGHHLMHKAIELMHTLLKEDVITISAQKHLELFYKAHGFESTGDEYLEDTIPHVKMKKNNI
ncbi:MAG: GNAT family N-acetyltransferase [Dysgonomonas sp.]